MKDKLRKALKAARLAREPLWRYGMRHGIAASIEHDKLQLASDFRTVIDVGANRGQFALYSLVRFPQARIYSLEPLVRPRQTMAALVQECNRLQVIPKAAGATTGTAQINVSHEDDSSSLLSIGKLQVERHPETAAVGVEEVEVTTLDTAMAGVDLDGPVLLKLDVQGFELEALKGASSLLQHVDTVLTEASFVSFYDGQVLFDELHAWLKQAGFALVNGSISSRASGRWEQGDFVYQRREPALEWAA